MCKEDFVSAGTAIHEHVVPSAGFRREVLRLRTRSGLEYGFSGFAVKLTVDWRDLAAGITEDVLNAVRAQSGDENIDDTLK